MSNEYHKYSLKFAVKSNGQLRDLESNSSVSKSETDWKTFFDQAKGIELLKLVSKVCLYVNQTDWPKKKWHLLWLTVIVTEK